VECCDCGRRLAEPRSELAGYLSQRIQNVFFPGSLHLLIGDDLPGIAVSGTQSQDILAAQCCNRSLQDGAASSCTLADLPRQLRSNPDIGRLTHKVKSMMNTFLRDKNNGWRLLQLHRQPLPQGFIEHRIARGIREVRDQNRALLAWDQPLAFVEKESNADRH
jgi:hypothetical protein